MNDDCDPKSPLKFDRHRGKIPDYITRHDIALMSDAELDVMVDVIRDRRMQSYRIYEQTQREKELVEQEKARAKIDRKCEMIIKKLNTIDKQLDTLEKYISELRGLRVQAGLKIL